MIKPGERRHRRRRYKLFLYFLAVFLLASIVSLKYIPATSETFGIVSESFLELNKKQAWRGWQFISGNKVSANEPDVVLKYALLIKKLEEIERQALSASAFETSEQARLRREEIWVQIKKIKPRVEAVIEDQLKIVARDEGLFSKIAFLETILPRPRIILTNPPRVLIASPRDKIEVVHSSYLGTELPPPEFTSIEESFEVKNPHLSARVETTGGIAVSYPAQVRHTSNLRSLLKTSAHEWLHQYLFFASRMGRSYFDNNASRTINETVANIAGRELGDKIFLRFYASEQEKESIDKEYAEARNMLRPGYKEVKPSPDHRKFHYNKFMRDTRLHVDALLASGNVADAESYMTARGEKLKEHGYYIRNLNQAYFAFRGSYADSPSNPDSMEPALQCLRVKSDSVSDFLKTISEVTSFEELEKILKNHGLSIKQKSSC